MGNGNKLIISFLPLLLIVTQVSALKCNCEGYFCISDKKYQLCQDGEVASDPIPCKEGLICRNETENECSHQPLCTKIQNSLDEKNSTMKIRNFCLNQISHPDPDDCQRFYNCTGIGTGELISCPPNTYYNERMFECTTNRPERCDNETEQFPNSFQCPGVGLFADPKNCRKYYQCDEWNNFFLKNCPEGTCFDEKLEDCVWNISSRCQDEKNDDVAPTTQTSQTDQETTEISTSYTEDDMESTVQTKVSEETTTVNDKITQQTIDDIEETKSTKTDSTERITDGPIISTLAPPKYDENGNFICPGEGYYPDPEDCHRYYVCGVVDRPMQVSCPEETYYDEGFCSIDMPERCRGTGNPLYTSTTVNNEDSKTEISSTKIPNEDDDRDTEKMTTTESTPSQFICPSEGLFPDTENCHRYYICNSFEGVVSMTCPNDTYYDEETTFCSSDIPKRCKEFGNTPDNVFTSTTANPTIPQNDGKEIQTFATERITTRKPQIRFECPGEGYFADPNNCHNYFACFYIGDSYISQMITCFEDTYFEEEMAFCSPEIPERCSDQPGTSTTTRPPNYDENYPCPHDGYYADPDDCTMYYMCYRNIVTRFTCPRGTYFDDEDNFCTKEIPERCRDSDEDNQRPTTPSYTENPTTDNDNNRFTCPGEGYYPDPENCRYYYVCYELAPPMSVLCPDNTYFNEEYSFCSNEIPERCHLIGRPPENHITTTQSPSTTERSPNNQINTTTRLPPTKEDFICPGEGYYSDPKNCQNYYVCFEENEFIQLSCPDNTFYDEETSFCVNNIPDRCRRTEKPSEDNSYTTTPKYDPAPPKDDFICPREGYFPDPKDCRRYYACFGFGVPLSIKCPRGTYFDERGFCTLKRQERCSLNEPQYSTKPPQQDQEFKCPQSGLFPDPKNCQKYWICQSKDFGYSANCPNGTYYQQESTYCTSYKPERCKNEDDEGFTCREEGYFADPYDCHSYHICYTLDISEHMRCPGNSYYHQSIKGCAPEKPDTCRIHENENKFVCSSEGNFPDPRDCTRYYNCTVFGDAVLMNCPQDEYFNENIRGCSFEIPPWCQSITPPSQNGFICTSAGYHPDPNNCSVYHICNIFGARYTSSCPSNTYYHEDTRTCSPIIPDRCIYLGNERLRSSNINNNQNKFILNDMGNPLNHTFVCPGKGLFPDPYNCRKFYVCYGQPRAVTCWGKTYFNENLQQCVEDMPERCRVSDDDRVTSPPGISSNNSQPEEFICPDSGLFPDPRNCHRFYVCYGQPRLVTCHNGMYYSEETQQCEEEMPERCKTNGEVTPQPPASTSQPGEFVCPGYGLFPDPKDCRKFYVCYGEQRHVTCRDGQYFHGDKQECDEELPIRCRPQDDHPPTTMETPTTPREIFECRYPGRYPDPLDCQSYYFCNWRQEAIHYNCKDSLYFNDITTKCEPHIPERCLSDEDRLTTPKTPSTFECTKAGRFPDPENCLNYYYCSDEDSTPIRYACPENEFFNINKGKCKKIKIGNECLNGNSDKVHSEDRYSDEDNSDEDDDDDNDEDEYFECKKPGIFADLRDCKKFYECSPSLQMKHKTCSGRTYFNEIYHHCSIFTTPRCKKYGSFW